MENSESYLNLNSDQFNSWLSEFETQFNKIEKKNLTSSQSDEVLEDNESICESIECSSESENNDSNIFIKDSSYQISSESENVVKSNSSTRRRIFNVSRPYRRSTVSEQVSESPIIQQSESQDRQKKESKKINKSKKSAIRLSEDTIKESNYEKPVNESVILTIQQINSIIPKIGHKKSSKKHVSKKEVVQTNDVEKVIENNKKNIRLGTQALYRFISKRAR